MSKKILTEHKSVFRSRHIFTIINFVFILAATSLTFWFMRIKGIDPILKLHIYALLAVNLLQVLVSIIDWMSKRKGTYHSGLYFFSWILGLLWFLLVASESVFAIMLSGFLRFDFIIIVALQLLTGIFAYIVWPLIDRRSIDKMTSVNVREDEEKRKKVAKGAWRRYLVFSILILIFEAGTLLAYKMPPNIYDIFDDSRALSYRVSDDGAGYVVTGVYAGTSDKVVVPATYNDKPVVGIDSGAFDASALLSGGEIRTITLGTVEKDDDEEVLVSNIEFISVNAICNNDIYSIEMPSSIENIAEGAIVSKSLKKIDYKSKANFRINYFDCPQLEKVTFSGNNVGRIEDLTGMGDHVRLEVSQEDYNDYRRNNPQYLTNFSPVLDDDEICVDFISNCGYYVESIIVDADVGVRLTLENLENENMTGKSIAIDTDAYIKDNKEMNTDGAKENSAFRGWYYDQNFLREFSFDQRFTQEIKQSVTLYAKWIDEYKCNLDWGTFKPEGTPNELYWTDESVLNFPQIENRLGYDRVEWYHDKQNYTNTEGLHHSIELRATWIMTVPDVSIKLNTDNNDTDFYIHYDEVDKIYDSVKFYFDEARELILEGVRSHPLDRINEVTYRYSWEFDENAYCARLNSDPIHNVNQSGKYTLTVIAESAKGEISSASTEIDVTVIPKLLAIGNFAMPDCKKTYNAEYQQINVMGSYEETALDLSYVYYDAQTNTVLNRDGKGIINAGDYAVELKLKKSDDTLGNYEIKTLKANFTIEKAALDCIGWENTSVVYDGAKHLPSILLEGFYGNDERAVIYEDAGQSDVGVYTARVAGVNNSNYYLNFGESDLVTEWRITKKQIYVSEWWLDGNKQSDSIGYDGEEHSAYAVSNDLVGSDRVSFTYKTEGNHRQSATDFGDYVTEITGITGQESKNYEYIQSNNENNTYSWRIEKRLLTLNFDENRFTYDGTYKSLRAVVGNIPASDLNRFSANGFATEFTRPDGIVGEVEGDHYVIGFNAIDAGSYTAKITDVIPGDLMNNYLFTAVTDTLVIDKKPLEFYTTEAEKVYNGTNISLITTIKDYAARDKDLFVKGKFALGDGSLEISEVRTSGSDINIVCLAKDVGDYLVSLTGFDNDNYETVPAAINFRINKRELSVRSWKLVDNSGNSGSTTFQTSYGYDSNACVYNYYGYKLEPIITGVATGETVDLECLSDNAVNIGNYTTTAKLPASYTNYTMSDVSVKWSVIPYAVNFGWTFAENRLLNAVNAKLDYNGAERKVEPVYELLGDDTITIAYDAEENDTSATNVGTFKVTVSGLNNANYTIGSNSSFSWSITAKTVKVIWAEGDRFVYNASYQGPSFTVEGLFDRDDLRFGANVNGSDATVDITSVDGSQSVGNLTIDAGEYTVYLTAILKNGKTDPNYVIASDQKSKPYVISKKTLTLSAWKVVNSASGLNKEYDGEVLIYNKNNYVFTKNITGGVYSRALGSSFVNDEVNLVFENNKFSAAGSYETSIVSLTGKHADNYQLPANGISIAWSIRPKSVNVTWYGMNFVFDNKEKSVYATYLNGASSNTDGFVYSGDYLNFTYSGERETDASDAYTARIVDTGNPNYSISDSTSYYLWQIAPKPVELVWSYSSIVYNGAAQYPVAAQTVNGATVNVTEYSFSATPVNVSEYTISAVALDNPNFTLANGSNLTKTFSITKLRAEIVWTVENDSEIISNNQQLFTYDGQTRKIVATVTNAPRATDKFVYTYSDTNTIKNAGTYTIVLNDIANSNYSFSSSITFTVARRELTCEWKQNTFLYDGENHTLLAELGNIVAGDVVNPIYDERAEYSNTQKNAGSYTVYITAVDNGNYYFRTTPSERLTINKREVTVSWQSKKTFLYDASNHSITASFGNLVGSDKLSISYNGNEKKNAGTYTVSIASLGNDNYSIPVDYQYAQFVIEPIEVSVNWAAEKSFVYSGSDFTMSATCGNVLSGDNVSFYYSNNSKRNCGQYTAQITGLSNSNYRLPSDGLTVAYEIKKAPVTFSWSSLEFTYNGTVQQPRVTYSTVSGNTITSEYKIYDNNGKDVTSTGAKDVGTYKVKLNALTADNYTIVGTASELEKQFTISKKALSLSWPTSTYTYNGQNRTITATLSGVISGDAVTLSYNNNVKKNAGSYTASITGIDNNNYQLPSKLTFDYVISPKTVSIYWSQNSFEYNGKNQTVTAAITTGIEGETITPTYTDNVKKDVGQYTARITSLNNANYALPSNVTCNFTITPKTVSVTWPTERSFEYNGNYQTVTATATTGISGESVTLSYSGNKQKNAGEYTAIITGTNNANYTLPSNVTCDFTITPKELTITWQGDISSTYDAKDHSVTATASTGVSGESVTLSYSGNKQKNAGEYTAIITGTNNANYTLPSNSTCNFTIEPKEVNITWQDTTSFTYNGYSHTVTATASTGILGESVSLTFADNSYINAGSYTAKVVAVNNSNYTIGKNSTCTFVIKQKEVTINWGSTKSFVYNGSTITVTPTITTGVGKTVNATIINNSQKNVGEYTATVISLNDSNFTLPSNASFTYTITPKEVTVKWPSSTSYEYTGSTITITPTITTGTGETINATVIGNTATGAGTYTAKITSLNNGNYSLPADTSFEFEVTGESSKAEE